MKLIVTKLFAGAAIIGLAACSGVGANYEPTVDGVKDAKYYGDLAACQNLSKEKSYASNRNAGATALGAGIGALTRSKGDRGDIAEGAAIGAGVAAAGSGVLTASERQNVIKNCMRGRGHNIVG
ncbi:MAG: glycine zipper family protein [Alphaproteobacteria bacterium]